MRAPTLQYFYLQKPMTLLVIISVISVLLWIGMGDFYTKGEPREASVAVSMIDEDNWVLPEVYADEIAYKPPLFHWMIAVFSLPQDAVTPFSSRLPSALAFITLIAVCFVFFGKNTKSQEAFMASLIMLTSFELHRAAMTARVDMLLTLFMVWALTRMFRWEERKKLKGFPIILPILLGLGALVKGPVAIILPLLVFGVYLLFLKYTIWKIAGRLTLVALVSLILPAIWYVMAYHLQGQYFLDIVWAENFGRFFGSTNLNIDYNLGHELPFYFNFIFLIAGFIPWTLLLFLSLFGIHFTSRIPGIKTWFSRICALPKIDLFALVASVVIVVFYCIPTSKRSVYLMPAYPFIALFISRYVLYLAEYKALISRIFSSVIGVIGVIVAAIGILTLTTSLIDPVQIARHFTRHERTLSDIASTMGALDRYPMILYLTLFCILIFALFFLFRYLWKKNNLKVLYATIGVYLAINLVLDGVFLPAFKNGTSSKPLAEALASHIDNEPVYVMNNLLEYSNMYGINFYMHNIFLNFEKQQPEQGLLLIGINDYWKVQQKYKDQYDFKLVGTVENLNRDGEREIVLSRFEEKK